MKKSKQYHIVNIVLSPIENQKTHNYIQVFTKLADLRKTVALNTDNAKNPKSGAISSFEKIGDDLYEGSFRKGINLPSDAKAYSLDENKEIPADTSPNLLYLPDTIKFWFVPSVHRLLISKKDGYKDLVKFLEKAIPEAVVGIDEVDINVVKSKASINRILQSDTISSLTIEVSYSNNDSGEEAKKLVDDILRKGNTRKAKMKFESPKNEFIDLKENVIARGALELSKDNGTAKAVIVENEQKITVTTDNSPEVYELTVLENGLPQKSDILGTIKGEASE